MQFCIFFHSRRTVVKYLDSFSFQVSSLCATSQNNKTTADNFSQLEIVQYLKIKIAGKTCQITGQKYNNSEALKFVYLVSILSLPISDIYFSFLNRCKKVLSPQICYCANFECL